MKLDAAALRELSLLLEQALALPAPARDAWLAALPAPHGAWRETLRDLLARHAAIETGDFAPATELLASSAGLAAGDNVGPYRLLEALGAGGMGTVWLADRSDGLLRRRVALKLPHVGWAPALAERFARERSILATLEHPLIARLYDAGLDERGRPYMALEHVEGAPIDTAARERGLDVAARVRLVMQVAEAVAYAHSRLVVHRDLKPSNILVTPAGQVRLLDFGIAKLLEDDGALETELTRAGGRMLTPAYAAPEQIAGEAIGTAADTWALGVLLYVLVAERQPFGGTGRAAVERAVLDSEPPPPCSAGSRVAELGRARAGDLDAIVLKALRKPPSERYATAAALAEDLGRWLADEPVRARRRSRRAAAWHLVRRHRVGVAASTAVLVAVVAGAVIALDQAARARQQAERAEAVQGFVLELFRANSADQPDPVAARRATVRELLDRGAARLATTLQGQPELRAALLETLVGLYHELGLPDPAARLAQEWLALAHGPLGGRGADVARAAMELARALDTQGAEPARVRALLAEAEAQLDALGDRDSPLRGQLHRLAAFHLVDTDPATARRHAERAVAILSAHPQSGPLLETALETFSHVLIRLGEHRLAAEVAGQALQRARANGRSEFRLETMLHRVGEIHAFAGQIDAADRHLREALTMSERVHGEDSIYTVQTRLTLARHYGWSGRQGAARPLADRSLAIARRPAQGQQPFQLLDVRRQVFEIYWGQGDLEACRALVNEAFSEIGTAAPDSFQHADMLLNRSMIELREGRLGAASDTLRAAQAMASRLRFGPQTLIVRLMRAQDVELLLAEGAAVAAAARVRELVAEQPSGNAPTAFTELLGRVLTHAGEPDEARRLLEGALGELEQAADRERRAELEASLLQGLAHIHAGHGRCADALPLARRSAALYSTVHVPTSPWLRAAQALERACGASIAAR